MPDTFTILHRALIVAPAGRYRLPAIYRYRYVSTEGGLVTYGPDLGEPFPLKAEYIDRILKGAAPADLPVQMPTRFELAINLKTAKALGLTVPPSLLARADEVIE
jgi:putative ABC transport system substrate-binding protein